MRKPTNIVWKTVDDSGSVVLDLESGRYYSLNNTALAAWIHLEAGLSLPATTQRVASAYGVDESRVGKDVEEFVGKLMGQGLIEEGEPQGASRSEATSAKPLPTGGGYVKPELSAHDAVETVTAGTSSGYSYSYTYYYYYYY